MHTSKPLSSTTITYNLKNSYYIIDNHFEKEILEMIHGIVGWENTQMFSSGKEPMEVVALLYFGFMDNLKCW
jgi:hypothetical protein